MNIEQRAVDFLFSIKKKTENIINSLSKLFVFYFLFFKLPLLLCCSVIVDYFFSSINNIERKVTFMNLFFPFNSILA